MDINNKKVIREWLGSGSINIFGMPLSGKDTQANLLGKFLGAPVIAGGQILRDHHEQEKIKKLSSTGKLFPTDYYFSIVLPHLSQSKFKGKPLVLSSLGRWAGEEQTIVAATKKSGHPIKAVVFLKLSESDALKRLRASSKSGSRGNRHDDREHLLDVRFNEFKTKTLPVINYYRNQGLLVEVDGKQSEKTVADSIIQGLLQFITNTT